VAQVARNLGLEEASVQRAAQQPTPHSVGVSDAWLGRVAAACGVRP